MTRVDTFTLALRVLALISAGNALWMLAHAWSWFAWIPGVTDTGPVNAHLVHDVGLAYGVCAIGLWWCAGRLDRPAHVRPVFLGVTLFFAGHALGHVVEILLGQLPHSHWWIDLPLVFAPALALATAALPACWRWVTATEDRR